MAQAIKKGSNAESEQKIALYSNRVNTLISPINPTRAFTGQARVLVAALQTKPEEWFVKKLKELAAKAARFFSLASDYPHTDMFLGAGHKIVGDLDSNNMEIVDGGETGPTWEAEKMLREVKAKWPETGKEVSAKLGVQGRHEE
jgi:hypothetical protein